jgi:tRNA U34 2-thiouridine synthase MnmA/TrmU
VIDNFADSYALGETPVPCIECNRSVKFAICSRPREPALRARHRALCRFAPHQ